MNNEISIAYNTEIKKKWSADVAVIGGGPAGVCAAIAAARCGIRVILAEAGGCCGGMATQGLVGPFMTSYDKSGGKMIIRGLFEEIVNRLVAKNGALHPQGIRAGTGYTSWIIDGHDHVTPFDPEILKVVLDEMLTEAGVKILYHTSFIAPKLNGQVLSGVILHSKSGYGEIDARVVIDCTGDADVAALCGVEYEYGNSAIGKTQPASLFFRIGNVDNAKLYADIEANLGNFYRRDGVNYRSLHWRVSEAKERGDWNFDRVSIGIFQGVAPGEWSINTSRIMGIDSTDNESLTDGEIIGRRQVEMIFKFLKKYVPGCEDARMLSTGATLGIRESRHIKGERVLTLEDIIDGKTPPDSILICSNSVDIHGRFGPSSNEYITVKNGNWYGIPYGCLVPLGVEQLLVAGRPISATSEAAGAVRVMPPCMGMGQAAGVAAALAVRGNTTVRELRVEEIRGVLIEQGAELAKE